MAWIKKINEKIIIIIIIIIIIYGNLTPASIMFYLTFHLLSDRGFIVSATEYCECSVVLLFRHHFMFLRKSAGFKHSGINTVMG